MTALLQAYDPAHGQLLPDWRPFAATLRRFFRRMGAAVVPEFVRSPRQIPNLSPWVQPLAEAGEPWLLRYFAAGGEAAARRILRLLRERARREREVRNLDIHYQLPNRLRGSFRRMAGADFDYRADSRHIAGPVLRAPLRVPGAVPSARRKNAPRGIEIAFDVYNPAVSDAVRQAALAFAQSTIDTMYASLQVTQRLFREQLIAGLERGDALAQMSARAADLFEDPARAHRIAMSEASRAVHAGELHQAIESNVVAKVEWLASSDACDRCLKLNGTAVPLGGAFHVEPGGGPYARVEHPPLHPHCMCSMTEVLKDF